MAAIETFTKDPEAVITYSIRWGAADWATATDYAVNDYVYDETDGGYYVCITKHTSSGALRTTSDSAKWSSVSGGLYLPSGVTISTSSWTVPTGITNDADNKTTQVALITLSGGVAGESYLLVNHVVLSNGSEDDRTIKVKIKEL